MQTTNLDTKINDFLSQRRIAVAGVSRNKSNHPVGNLIYHRLKDLGHDVFPSARIVRECADAGVRRIWMHASTAKGSSVSAEAVEFCRQHDITVIAGACPMMYGPGVDFGHRCLRLILKLRGGLPS